jgi:hypothetical protein
MATPLRMRDGGFDRRLTYVELCFDYFAEPPLGGTGSNGSG